MAGTLTISTLSDGTNSTSSTNCIQGSAKAWVNFNGSGGTIRTSYNVSSITVNGTGDYTINFTNALTDANYAVNMSGGNAGGSAQYLGYMADGATVPTSSAFRINTVAAAGAVANFTRNFISVFR